jgi:hypothetical protein
MKIRLLFALTGLVISFALPLFAQQTNTVDPEVRQQIETVFMKFGDAFNKHDPVAIAALFTPDAVQLWPWMSEGAVKRFASLLSSPGEFVGQVVEVYPIGNDMSVISKGSVGLYGRVIENGSACTMLILGRFELNTLIYR